MSSPRNQKSLVTRWEFWTLGVASLVIIAIVAYSIVTKKGDEGFIQSLDGDDYVWPTLPIICYVEPNTPDSIVISFERASDYFTTKCKVKFTTKCVKWVEPTMPVKPGFGVVRLGKRDSQGTSSEGFLSHEAGASTFLYADKYGIISNGSTVYVDDLDPTLLDPILRHEYGHLLGLAHDTYPGSLMQAILDVFITKNVFGNDLYPLLDTDVTRLKRKYDVYNKR